MLPGAAQELPAPTAEPGRVRSLTQEILRRNEFRPPRRSLLEALWHWISTELGKLLGQIFGGATATGGGAYLAAVVVAVVVAAAVWLIVAHRLRGAPPAHRPVVVLRDQPSRRPPAEWRAEAAAHEVAGHWRDALRCRYRALIAELAGQGVVVEMPGCTSGEYRHDVGAADPGASPAFNGATDLFEEAWYGDRRTGPEDQVIFDDLARRVLASH